MTRALIGLDKRDSGRVVLDGKEIAKNSPIKARLAGMGLVPENRQTEGILTQHVR